MKFIQRIIFHLLGGAKIEEKLLKCQSYQKGRVIDWKYQMKFSWIFVIKILKKLVIFDGIAVRRYLKEIVRANPQIFQQKNTFVVAFGKPGKSGELILYEFRHSTASRAEQISSIWQLSQLPAKSTIVFVDDIIGSGSQSFEYITKNLYPFLQPSFNLILLTICATVEGIDKIEADTDFKVLTGVILEESEFFHYSPKSNYFSPQQKSDLIDLNHRLKDSQQNDFDLGLLISFHYSPPNNTMPFIWKDIFPYQKKNGTEANWIALIPRKYE